MNDHQDLFRIIYLSRNRVEGAPEEVTRSLERILESARRRNSECGVGGLLMFNNGCFLQVLEGAMDRVEQTFERIQRDKRHDRIVVLEAKPVDERTFPEWTMAFVGEDRADRARYSGMSLDAAKMAIMSNDRMLSKLRDLVQDEEIVQAA